MQWFPNTVQVAPQLTTDFTQLPFPKFARARVYVGGSVHLAVFDFFKILICALDFL
jgi:hypothetical protein